MIFVFNFKDRFADLVATGEKRQTIRARRADGRVPTSGDRVRAYSGLRRPNPRLLYDAPVVECFSVQMYLKRAYRFGPDTRWVVANGTLLTGQAMENFARLDGFSSREDMLDWFSEAHDEHFKGWCVRWGSS